MKFSIITPSFNQGEFIERTILSVLEQEGVEWEYLVFDGGSTDNTVAVLEQYDEQIDHWVSEPDRGQTHAVNKGLEHASGDIIGWLNSDDTYTAGALRSVADVFERHPEANFVYGRADYIDANDEIIRPYPIKTWDFRELSIDCYICQPALFFRRSVVEEYGFLDESLNYCMDYEYWLRCGEKEAFVHIPETLACSRLYEDNKTLGDRPMVLNETLEMLKLRLGFVPRRWVAEHAIEHTRQHRGTEPRGLERFAWCWEAMALWHSNQWAYNRRMMPFYPLQFMACMPLVPEMVRQAARKIKAKPSAPRTQ